MITQKDEEKNLNPDGKHILLKSININYLMCTSNNDENHPVNKIYSYFLSLHIDVKSGLHLRH